MTLRLVIDVRRICSKIGDSEQVKAHLLGSAAP
jgi:hypothetical protein